MAGEAPVYQLVGFAVPEELDRVHELIERAGSEHPDIDLTDLVLFETAVIEIANNVVKHGKPTGEVRWRLTVTVGDNDVRADLFDSGQVAKVEFDADMPDGYAESGRGLSLASALLDEIGVERTIEGNHWRLVKRFSGSAGE